VRVSLVDPSGHIHNPYGNGWMVKIKLTESSEIDGLLTADQYQELVG